MKHPDKFHDLRKVTDAVRPDALPETYHAELDPPGPALAVIHAAAVLVVGMCIGAAVTLLVGLT